MNILAIETSTKACSAALKTGDKIYYKEAITPQTHAQNILGMIQDVLSEAKLGSDDVDILAFGEGPGAFTGIRIASGVIQGLALGWGLDVLPVSSTEALAFKMMKASQLEQGQAVALIDARMNELYMQKVQWQGLEQNLDWQATEVSMLSPEQAEAECEAQGLFESAYAMGDIEDSFEPLAKRFAHYTFAYPSAKEMVELADYKLTHKLANALSLTEMVPTPVYLRNKIADTIEERKAKAARN